MASLIYSMPILKRRSIIRCWLHDSGSCKPMKARDVSTSPCTRLKNLPPLLCTKSLPWEADGIVKGVNIVDTEDEHNLPILQSEQEAIDTKSLPLLQPLKWPMWLLGPSVLLATGMVPTLWLPLSSVFQGPNIAGLLSLLGLDCIFNMGATLFLLMADACARGGRSSVELETRVPLQYKIWNQGASLVGIIAPLVMLVASYKGYVGPRLPFISFAVLLGPYLLLLCVQVLTEALTWHWRSPVWLMAPVVYESYRVLQLMRGLKLAGEVGAPLWMVESIRGLVCWWILILGVQLMRVAWFAGLASRNPCQT